MWINLCLLIILNINLCSFYLIFIKNPMFCIMWLVYFYILMSLFLLLFGFEYYSMLVVLLYVGAIAVIFLFICMMLHVFEVEYDYEFKNVNYNNFFFSLWEYKNLFFYFIINNFLWFLFDEDFDILIYLDNFEFIYFFWNIFYTRLENIEFLSHFLYNIFYYPFLLSGLILLFLVICCIILILAHDKDL
jgi:NADH:ubiquinone oxidoreductase subunit 6 (subunit J)